MQTPFIPTLYQAFKSKWLAAPLLPLEDMHIIYFIRVHATIVYSFVIVFFVRRCDDLWENKRNKYTVQKYAGSLHYSRYRPQMYVNGAFWLLIISVPLIGQTLVECRYIHDILYRFYYNIIVVRSPCVPSELVIQLGGFFYILKPIQFSPFKTITTQNFLIKFSIYLTIIITHFEVFYK